jgi:hypothetical protein
VYLGYDTEIAFGPEYFTTKLDKISIDAMISKAVAPRAGFTVTHSWYVTDVVPCSGTIKLGTDRIGLVLHAIGSDREYDVFIELAMFIQISGAQLIPTRSAEVCFSGNGSLPEVTEIRRATDDFLWTASNWPLQPLNLVKNPLGDVTPYMETIAGNVSVFAKGMNGRHPLLLPVEKVRSGYDIAISSLTNGIKQVVLAAVAQQNSSPEFNVPFHHTSAQFQRGPIFNTQGSGSIDFVVGIYRKDEGGDIPADEWHLDLSGKAVIRAEFVKSGAGGYFNLRQVGKLSDVSGSFTWKFTGITLGLNDRKLPGFVTDFLEDFVGIQQPSLKPVPVSIDDALSIDCEIRADRVLLWVRMAK